MNCACEALRQSLCPPQWPSLCTCGATGPCTWAWRPRFSVFPQCMLLCPCILRCRPLLGPTCLSSRRAGSTPSPAAARAKSWERACLQRLDTALKKLGSRLIIRRVASSAEAAPVLIAIAREVGAKAVHANQSFNPLMNDLNRTVEASLVAAGVRGLPSLCVATHSHVIQFFGMRNSESYRRCRQVFRLVVI